jgi:hypothetical protein
MWEELKVDSKMGRACIAEPYPSANPVVSTDFVCSVRAPATCTQEQNYNPVNKENLWLQAANWSDCQKIKARISSSIRNRKVKW